MATQPLQHDSHQARQHTLLIATRDPGQRAFLAAQLDADGHTVYEADHAAAVIARLSVQAIDVLVLGELERPANAPTLLRAVRCGEHPRIHPGQAVITIGAGDELTTLRAYECGSDHHLPDDTGYLLVRAVLRSVVRRALQDVTTRYLRVGDIHVDLAGATWHASPQVGGDCKTAKRTSPDASAPSGRTPRLGFEPRSDLVQVGQIRPPADVAQALALADDDDALIRKRHMYAADTPVDRQGHAARADGYRPRRDYSRLAELGHAPARFTELIALRPPTSEEADFLRLSDEQHVLAVFHTAWTSDDRTVEVTIHVLPPHQWELHYDWSAEPSR
jgi:UTRA domain-containing protein